MANGEEPLQVNKKGAAILVGALLFNFAFHLAERRGWIDHGTAEDVELLKDQLSVLILGQTPRALRRWKQRA